MKHAYLEFLKNKTLPATDMEIVYFIVDYYIDRIRNGALPGNTRVTSIAGLAKKLEIKRSYAIRAHDILKSAGYFVAVEGSHTYVNPDFPDLADVNNMVFAKKLGERVMASPQSVVKGNKNGGANYIDTGIEALSPAVYMEDKPNKIIDAIAGFFPSPEGWDVRHTLEGRFLEIAQFNRAKTRFLKMAPEQITIGYYRAKMIDTLFSIVVRENEGILLASHTDYMIVDALKKRTKNLFYVDCDQNGLPLDKVQKMVEESRKTDVPISIIFSNPIWDAFNWGKNIHVRRAKQVKLAKSLDVLLLEEYDHDEWVESPGMPLLKRAELGPMDQLVTFGGLSMFLPESDNIMVLMGPDDVIAKFRAKQQRIRYNEGLALRVIDQLNQNGGYTLIVNKGIESINRWRKKIEASAKKHLENWLVVQASDCDGSLWLLSRGGREIRLSADLSNLDCNLGLSFSEPTEPSSSFVKIGGVRVCFGSGKIKEFDRFFEKLKEDILRWERK